MWFNEVRHHELCEVGAAIAVTYVGWRRKGDAVGEVVVLGERSIEEAEDRSKSTHNNDVDCKAMKMAWSKSWIVTLEMVATTSLG